MWPEAPGDSRVWKISQPVRGYARAHNLYVSETGAGAMVVRVWRARCSRIDWKHMAYDHILEMVDEYLDRLMRARQLLLMRDRQCGGPEPVTRSRGMHAPLEQAATSRKRTQPKPDKLLKSEGGSARTKRQATDARFMQKELLSSGLRKSLFLEAPGKGSLKVEGPEEKQSKKRISDPKADIAQRAERPLRRTEGAWDRPRIQPEVFAAPVELREATEPRQETRRKRLTPMPRALGGMVSATPVFIPAARLQQELTQKAEAGTKEEGAVEMPVTVALLTQRWVQGLVS